MHRRVNKFSIIQLHNWSRKRAHKVPALLTKLVLIATTSTIALYLDNVLKYWSLKNISTRGWWKPEQLVSERNGQRGKKGLRNAIQQLLIFIPTFFKIGKGIQSLVNYNTWARISYIGIDYYRRLTDSCIYLRSQLASLHHPKQCDSPSRRWRVAAPRPCGHVLSALCTTAS